MAMGYMIFLLPCLLLLLLLSPIVVRFSKGERTSLSLHFVFFSVMLFRLDKKEKKTKKSNGSKKAFFRALRRALRYAMPRAALCIARLPYPEIEDPFYRAIGHGGYCFLLSVLCAPFGRQTDKAHLDEGCAEKRTVDIQLRMRFYVFLHTFLIYMAQYRKEKEAESFYVRNENE